MRSLLCARCGENVGLDFLHLAKLDFNRRRTEEAYVFCSLACDLRVTQLVDGNKGIHAMVERGLVQ
jgi:acetamidase/formamidase